MDRGEALWAVRRWSDEAVWPLFAAFALDEQPQEEIAPLPPMPLSEHVIADYQSLRLSLKAYPTQFLRELFRREGLMSCAEIGSAPQAQRARWAGIAGGRRLPCAPGVVSVVFSARP